MINKEALAVISGMIDKYNECLGKREIATVELKDDVIVALYKVDYILRKLVRMEEDLAEEYVDLLDVDYPRRDDYWDGYNTGYHDCEVEHQAKEKEDDGSNPKQSGNEE